MEQNDKDYLELWKYFQDRADKIKEAMFQTVTWTIGFAAALLGFLAVKLTDFDESKAAVAVFWLILITAVAGLFICAYSCFAIHEAGRHIEENWQSAKRCKGQMGKQLQERMQLQEILPPAAAKGETEEKKKKFWYIWRQLYVIVALFAIAFVVVLGWDLVSHPATPTTSPHLTTNAIFYITPPGKTN